MKYQTFFLFIATLLLFSNCHQKVNETWLSQLKTSNDILQEEIDSKRIRLIAFQVEYPHRKESIICKEFIKKYDDNPFKFLNPKKIDTAIKWLNEDILSDTVQFNPSNLSFVQTENLKGQPFEFKRNLFLTTVFKVFSQIQRKCGAHNISCNFGPFMAASLLKGENIIVVTSPIPLLGLDYTISINEPKAEVVEASLLGFIVLPDTVRSDYQVIVTSEDRLEGKMRIDTANVFYE